MIFEYWRSCDFIAFISSLIEVNFCCSYDGLITHKVLLSAASKYVALTLDFNEWRSEEVMSFLLSLSVDTNKRRLLTPKIVNSMNTLLLSEWTTSLGRVSALLALNW